MLGSGGGVCLIVFGWLVLCGDMLRVVWAGVLSVIDRSGECLGRLEVGLENLFAGRCVQVLH